ncbi:MAG: ATP-binding protein, partial [Bacteroidota bacterium]
MEKFFNTAGPIKTNLHHYVPMEERWDVDRVQMMIRQQKYFILHAPRQTGKTSSILALADFLNQRGEYVAVYANIEPAQAAREDVSRGIRAVLVSIASALRYFTKSELLRDHWLPIFEQAGPEKALEELLSFWAEQSPKPVVLILDEVDALIGDTLISLLRQLRAGYNKRPEGFPVSVILCGVRDVRDYRIHSARTKEIVTGGSAFNVKAESLRMENFSREQIAQLYRQHTEATGQIWEEGILALAWHYTE